MLVRSVLVFIVLTLGAGSAGAAGAPDAFEKQVVAELVRVAPEAVPLLERAEEARRAERLDEARGLYVQVLDAAPGFMHAERRLCVVESQLGNRTRALELCNAALAQGETPENLSALAAALVTPGDSRPSPADIEEATALVGEATQLDPDAAHAWTVLCMIGAASEDIGRLGACSANLMRLEPDSPTGFYFAVLVAGERGAWSAAREHLERARALGLPDDMYQPLDDAISEHEPLWPTILKLCLLVIAIWVGAMLLLFVVGAVLSRLTMKSAEEMAAADAGAPVHAAGASLRRIYKAVLRLSCVFYYLSLPALALLILATGGGIIYAFWAAGTIPVKLVLIIGILVVVTLGAIGKGIFVRGRDDEPGEKLDLTAHPKMREVLDEVAGKIQTRPVDSVYLTPGTDIAVFERGALLAQMRGHSERCLILGVGVIEGMPLAAFKAILAHEYGHFSNRDTADGGFALAVRRSLITMGVSLAEGGSAAWYNPAWLFFRGFYAVFQRISQGASRLQEIMADRWAVLSYGARNFETGLRHAIERTVAFDSHVDRTLKEVIEQRYPLPNLYGYRPASELEPGVLAADVEAAIHREPSQYDSHPRPADRFRWAHAMGAPEPAAETTANVWSLFEDRDRLEREMTAKVRWNVEASYGVEIPSV